MKNLVITLSGPRMLLICAAFLASSNVNAQEHTEHQHGTKEKAKSKENSSLDDMDHSKMNHREMAEAEVSREEMGQSKMSSEDMDHSKMNHKEMAKAEVSHEGMDHSKMSPEKMDPAMDHSQMKHGDTQAQGGDVPANARDPHAYSSGYTLTEGPYALDVPKRLTLADEHSFWAILGDRLEYNSDENSSVYDVQGWYGTTFDRAVVKAEGDVVQGSLIESQTELLWSHAVSTFWDTQLGLRYDRYDQGQDRSWVAFGFQGLAPYWFEVDISVYLGENGHTALSTEAEYELLLSQQWVLQSRVEMSINGKSDEINGVGKGLSSLNAGIRLRYEFSRQFAPYIGIEWSRKFGESADFARLENEKIHITNVVAGLRFWF